MSIEVKTMRVGCQARQRGAVLVVSLLLLLVMSVLALAASQATRMQERMAGNSRDYDLALQSAEAGLRKAERLIDDPNLTAAPFPCTSGRCQVFELNILPADIAYRSHTAWWDDNAWTYSSGLTWTNTQQNELTGAGRAHRDPQYVIEEVEEVPDSLKASPTGPSPSRIYYRITSAAEGGTDRAVVVLQSTFARRFN
jgi:type IV pilus assembly protein PilX